MNKTQQIMVFKMIFVYLGLILRQIAKDDTVRFMDTAIKGMWQKIEGE